MTSPRPPLPDLAALERLTGQLRAVASGLSALAKAGSGPKLSAALDPLVAIGPISALGAEVDAALAPVLAWSADERAERRRLLAEGLKRGAAERGLRLRVLSKEPLELRLPPFGVLISVEGDLCQLFFAKEEVARCGATAGELFSTWATARETLDGDFLPEAFFAQLQSAYQRLGGAGWVELADLWRELVWLRQPEAFRREPSARAFVAYPRWAFAYDLWRLRRDRRLSQGGQRLSLAPATGGAMRDKSRLFFLEDPDGEGTFHASARIEPEEVAGG